MNSRSVLQSLCAKENVIASVRWFWKPKAQEPKIPEPLTDEQRKQFRKSLANVCADDNVVQVHTKPLKVKVDAEIDSIRARGFLKYRYNYSPPVDIKELIKKSAQESGINLSSSWQSTLIKNLDLKYAFLHQVGTALRHFVPNSRLHKLKTLSDVVEFYSEPVKNITKFSEMARDETLPQNIAILEQPVRFHPNDKHAVHGGITAFPGDGGKVFGIRNKRLLRQFQPKKDWFEYEDRTFDYEPVDKGMPWDPEVAKKIDRYGTKKFFPKGLKK